MYILVSETMSDQTQKEVKLKSNLGGTLTIVSPFHSELDIKPEIEQPINGDEQELAAVEGINRVSHGGIARWSLTVKGYEHSFHHIKTLFIYDYIIIRKTEPKTKLPEIVPPEKSMKK